MKERDWRAGPDGQPYYDKEPELTFEEMSYNQDYVAYGPKMANFLRKFEQSTVGKVYGIMLRSVLDDTHFKEGD